MKRICVFCGSAKGSNPIYQTLAQRLGQALVRADLELVFGGGHIGLMGVLADAVLEAGGQAIGVIPQALRDKELAHQGLGALHIVGSMHERKALMADLADGFIALPGGFGTADELFEILTWSQLGLHAKPIGLLNVSRYFDPLLDWLNRCMAEGFLRARDRQLLLVAEEVEALLEAVVQFHAAPPTKTWKLEPEDR